MGYLFWTLALVVLVFVGILSPQFEAFLDAKSKRMDKMLEEVKAKGDELKKLGERLEATRDRLLKLRRIKPDEDSN